MQAVLGRPPAEFLARSAKSPQFWDANGLYNPPMFEPSCKGTRSSNALFASRPMERSSSNSGSRSRDSGRKTWRRRKGRLPAIPEAHALLVAGRKSNCKGAVVWSLVDARSFQINRVYRFFVFFKLCMYLFSLWPSRVVESSPAHTTSMSTLFIDMASTEVYLLVATYACQMYGWAGGTNPRPEKYISEYVLQQCILIYIVSYKEDNTTRIESKY